MEGTMKDRMSLPHTPLTVRGGPHAICSLRCLSALARCLSAIARRVSAACRAASTAAVSASFATATAIALVSTATAFFVAFFGGGNARPPPRPCTSFLGSKSANIALASSFLALTASAATVSALAFLTLPMALYARARYTSALSNIGLICSARVVSTTTSAYWRRCRKHAPRLACSAAASGAPVAMSFRPCSNAAEDNLYWRSANRRFPSSLSSMARCWKMASSSSTGAAGAFLVFAIFAGCNATPVYGGLCLSWLLCLCWWVMQRGVCGRRGEVP
mmetsp:Transcript_30263/g.48716  ORF Transcript_30263/g.48716 Transcript_30263/m.48716 type:complete len:276 (-) Transcript_30263:8-835(-)